MVVIIAEDQVHRAQEIMAQYNQKLVYSKVVYNNHFYYAISEGPVGALLTIRAELGRAELQKHFGLL